MFLSGPLMFLSHFPEVPLKFLYVPLTFPQYSSHVPLMFLSGPSNVPLTFPYVPLMFPLCSSPVPECSPHIPRMFLLRSSHVLLFCKRCCHLLDIIQVRVRGFRDVWHHLKETVQLWPCVCFQRPPAGSWSPAWLIPSSLLSERSLPPPPGNTFLRNTPSPGFQVKSPPGRSWLDASWWTRRRSAGSDLLKVDPETLRVKEKVMWSYCQRVFLCL